MFQRNRGFTVIELLIVVAILGTLLAVGFGRLQPPTARVLASDLKAMLHQARYEAVKRNQPVAFYWTGGSGDSDEFLIRLDSESSDAAAACQGDTVLSRKPVAEYPRAQVVVSLPADGVVWLPNGQGRSCQGRPMVSTDIVVDDGRNNFTVDISMGGKVAIR